ncbi:class I SAM-dependent methyltransferase [Paenibacillus tarimensis]|uniref:class I SAM-dependent methyltransferase n=1 Tax=Paenibacillus tarimensis TaxID=416012 RepID=UPI001F3E8EEC|nr:class I SAM-dependent methyltransferase [Paenibacillus tarimensis]MCF2943700.1 SAM-dependent methyltransferase [Paenibacillus tarimensis]
MGFVSVLAMAHKLVQDRVQPGDCAVDATVGNGIDTSVLCNLTGPKGAVFGFDVQETALQTAEQRVRRECGSAAQSLKLILASHEHMLQHLPAVYHGQAAAVMFNLGYLPNADSEETQRIITEPQSTLTALQASLTVLRPRGVLTIVVYPGHAGGAEEAEAVLAWAAQLPSATGQAMTYRMVQKPSAPYLIAVERR